LASCSMPRICICMLKVRLVSPEQPVLCIFMRPTNTMVLTMETCPARTLLVMSWKAFI